MDNARKLFRVDSSFFDVFTFPFIQGNAKNAFKEVNSIVLTQATAKKYFGSEEPMGKVLHIDALGDMMVTGVLKDIPGNAHFHFDFLISIRKFSGNIDANWGFYNFYTSIKLQPNVNIAGVEPKIKALYQRNNPKESNVYYTQPLTTIHLDSNLKWEIEPNSERLYVIVFAIVGLLIILIAAINYINLVTARSSLRAKEIGIRKILGANLSGIAALLSVDFLKLVLLAIIIASPIAWWSMHKWLETFAYRIAIQWWMFAGAALLAVIVATLTVSYHAIKAGVSNPVNSLRND